MSRLAASTCLMLALATACAAPAWAKTGDRNQPMDLAADSQDCSIQDDGPCVFTGNVKVVQGTLEIQAAKADVRRGGGDIQRVLLSGGGKPVRMKQALDSGGTMDARASNVDYDMPRDIVTFTGNVEIDQPGRGTIASERVVYNMQTGQVQAGGGKGGGQVKTRILPKGAQQGAQAPQGGG